MAPLQTLGETIIMLTLATSFWCRMLQLRLTSEIPLCGPAEVKEWQQSPEDVVLNSCFSSLLILTTQKVFILSDSQHVL